VSWVSYLGLPSHDSYQLALSLVRKDAFGGVLSFGIKGDDVKARKVIDGLKLASNLANVGTWRLSYFCLSAVQLHPLTHGSRCRRREDARHPPSVDNALAAHRGGADPGGRHARWDPGAS
jgi:cystathionine beta-lyase/cystathionine gamma-synthase